MTGFDGWEGGLYGSSLALSYKSGLSDTELMHFRTKGSKNGIRRFQNPDGSWTPLGLKERREREGFGERRAARKEARMERRAVRAEAKAARRAARAEKKAEIKEQRRKSNIKTMTDAELQAKINRINMERQYKELTKKEHPILENGAKLVTKYLEYRQSQDKQRAERNKQLIELAKAKETTKQKMQEAQKAKSEATAAEEKRKQTEADVKGGLKLERKRNLLGAKKAYKDTTIRGGITKRINAILSSGVSARIAAKRTAKGEAAAKNLLSKMGKKTLYRDTNASIWAKEKVGVSDRSEQTKNIKNEIRNRKRVRRFNRNWRTGSAMQMPFPT